MRVHARQVAVYHNSMMAPDASANIEATPIIDDSNYRLGQVIPCSV